jgi:5-methylcytosine-specific restriction endonuclease McrA
MQQGTCVCGEPLPPPKGKPRNPRKWCSEGCRVRMHKARANPLTLLRPDAPEAVSSYRMALRHDPCAYCGSASETIDHIEAQGEGGRNHWSNLTGACGNCNQRKGTRPLLGFLLAKPLLIQRDQINAELQLLRA